MARNFSGATQYFTQGAGYSKPVWPYTMACWAFPTGTPTTNPTALALNLAGGGGDGNASEGFEINNAASNKWIAFSYDGTTFVSSQGSVFVANAWIHVAGIFTSASSRQLFLNGVAQTANTSTISATGPNTTNFLVGNWVSGTNNFFGGRVAEVLVYNGALSTAQIRALAGGVHPFRVVKWAGINFYCPFYGLNDPNNASNETSAFGKMGFEFVKTGSPTLAAHAPVAPPFIGPAGFGADVAISGSLLYPRDMSGVDGRYHSPAMTGGMGA